MFVFFYSSRVRQPDDEDVRLDLDPDIEVELCAIHVYPPSFQYLLYLKTWRMESIADQARDCLRWAAKIFSGRVKGRDFRNLWYDCAEDGVPYRCPASLARAVLLLALMFAAMSSPAASDDRRPAHDGPRLELAADPPGGKTDTYIPTC